MALAFTTDENGSVTGTHRTSFAGRKAARVAAGARQFRFQVVAAGFDFFGEVVGEFSSRKDADAFVNGQIGPLAGHSPAYRALADRHPEAFLAFSQRWNIFRVA